MIILSEFLLFFITLYNLYPQLYCLNTLGDSHISYSFIGMRYFGCHMVCRWHLYFFREFKKNPFKQPVNLAAVDLQQDTPVTNAGESAGGFGCCLHFLRNLP